MPPVGGVDGCPEGWLLARTTADPSRVGVSVFARFDELLESNRDLEIVAIDIPIGLTLTGPRPTDRAARALLGPRGASVFPAPVRASLAALTYSEACEISFATHGKKLSKQSFAIMPKISEVDQVLRKDPSASRRVREIHPEVSFCVWNGDRPMEHPKRSGLGFTERLRLESVSQLREVAPADDRTSKMQEAKVVARAAVVSGAQPTHGIEPREVAFDHPAMATEALLRLDTAPGDPSPDVARVASGATLPKVVSLVRVHLDGAPPRPTGTAPLQGRDGVQQLFEHLTVVAVRGRQPDRERDPGGVDHKMALAARSAFIRRIRADDVAPLFAATVELSRAARLQSISSAQLSSCNNSRCKRRQTPRFVHVRKRRQHVEPLPQFSSSGSSCQGSAVRSTKRMPVNAW